MKKIINWIKNNKILSVVLSVLIIALFFETGYIKSIKGKAENIREASYRKAFFDLSSSISDISNNLSKALVTDSPKKLYEISSEINTMAACAKSALGYLPLKNIDFNESMTFLSQAGEYIYSLSNKSAVGITDRKNLKDLSAYGEKLKNSVLNMENAFLTGELDFDSIISSDNEDGNIYLSDAHSSLGRYPSLIYDGASSHHNLNLSKESTVPEITEEEARKKALDFLSHINIIKTNSENRTEGMTETYCFSMEDDKENKYFIDVTVKGGNIISFISSKEVDDEKIIYNEALKKAQAFLRDKGFSNLKASYYEKENGFYTIRFFPEENDITFYPDLVIIKIAADDGSVAGFECSNYIKNHTQRTNLIPKISVEQAKEELNSEFEIKNVRLSVLPIYQGKEELCYEFYGSLNTKDYLCYINAMDNSTEKILLLINENNRVYTL